MCYQSVRKETESMGGFIILISDSSSQEGNLRETWPCSTTQW